MIFLFIRYNCFRYSVINQDMTRKKINFECYIFIFINVFPLLTNRTGRVVFLCRFNLFKFLGVSKKISLKKFIKGC